MYSARMSAYMGERCRKGKREVKLWPARTRPAHLSCNGARISTSMRGRRLKGKKTGNYGARENDGRFPYFSRTLHVLARACQLACVEGIWRGNERGIIARKNRMGGPPPLRPLYVFACLRLVSLSIPLNACRASYRSAFSRVAIFTRLLAQLAHSDIPEKVRYDSQPMFRDFMLFLVI